VLKVLKVLTVLPVAIVLGVTVLAQMTPEAIEGLDPVLLTQGKEVPGKDAFSVVHGGLKYFFSTADTKGAFETNPEQYAVQLDGTCARMGSAVGGNPNTYSVHDGRIYLFGSDNCKELFDAAPEKYLEAPAAAMEATSAERAAGRAALDKVAAAMGAVDRITAFEEHGSRSAPVGGGMPGQDTKVALFWSVPDRLRLETTFAQFGTVANILTSSDEFTALPKSVRQLQRRQATELRRQAFRHPVVLVRTRTSPDVQIAGRAADAVDVQALGGPVATLRIDAATGLPVSLSFRGRGPDGDLGAVVHTFSDYRKADGVMVPFTRTVTFNGAPVPQQSVAVDSVAINKPIDAARFSRSVSP
jgi:YHS domain-containing protein